LFLSHSPTRGCSFVTPRPRSILAQHDVANFSLRTPPHLRQIRRQPHHPGHPRRLEPQVAPHIVPIPIPRLRHHLPLPHLQASKNSKPTSKGRSNLSGHPVGRVPRPGAPHLRGPSGPPPPVGNESSRSAPSSALSSKAPHPPFPSAPAGARPFPCPAGGRHNRRPGQSIHPRRGQPGRQYVAMAPFVSKVRTDPAAEVRQIGINHQLDEVFELRLRLPAYLPVGIKSSRLARTPSLDDLGQISIPFC
jgi:hypothetical protein